MIYSSCYFWAFQSYFTRNSTTADCIYPWTHSRKTCFHVTSNVWVSGVKLSSFHAQLGSFTSQCPLLKWKMILINKKGRNYQKGVPLSMIWGIKWKNLLRIILSQKLGEDLGAVSKIIKHHTQHLGGETSKFDIWNSDVWRHVKTCFVWVHSRVDDINGR